MELLLDENGKLNFSTKPNNACAVEQDGYILMYVLLVNQYAYAGYLQQWRGGISGGLVYRLVGR